MKRSLRSWLWQVPLKQEVDEELAFHIEMRTRELVERGIDPRAAREMVVARLGDMERLKRTCVDLGRKRDREMRITRWLNELAGDVRFAIRQMKASPGFTLVAAMTLALGIGANSAMFALVDAALLRPLPFSEPDRLMVVRERGRARPPGLGRVTPLDFYDWKARNRSFEQMAAYSPTATGGVSMTGADGTAEIVSSRPVTAGFFDVLRVKPIAGRTFLPDDEMNAGAVVLHEGFWRARFGADPALIGRDIRLAGRSATVIGVVPAGFEFISPTSIWTILPQARAPNFRQLHFLQVMGRLKPGVTMEAAHSDMLSIAEQLEREFPATNTDHMAEVAPLRDALVGGELRVTSILFLGVVGFVLLVCCANVANLLMARATVRARELAIRSALGAGRPRIVAQLLTESLVLAVLGGVMGLGIGAGILEATPSLVPQGLLPGTVTLAFDARVVTFCAATALVVGLLFGIAPAWHATSVSLVQALSSDARTSTGRAGGFRSLLVIGEVAAAVLLLCGAGLLLRTLLTVERFDPGYRAQHVFALNLSLPIGAPNDAGARYPTENSLQRFFDTVEQEVMAIPGVERAGWASTLPIGPSTIGQFGFEIVGDPPRAENERPNANYQIVSPSYFETVDLPIVAGRAFTDRDTRETVAVCIVNEAFVRAHLGGRDPIGMRIAIRPMTITGSPQPIVREIVGVARQVKGRPDELRDFVQLYVPNAQNAYNDAYLLVRSADNRIDALVPAVRRAIARVDKDLASRGVITLEDVASEATARHRFRAVLVTTFAGLALLLAMVGIFGLLAYSVQQRSRELGVRIALGASTGSVLLLVLGGAARVIAAGAVIGLVAAGVLGQSIAVFLFGVKPFDPVTFASVALVLVVTAIVATAAPAFRATRVDPVVAFRAE